MIPSESSTISLFGVLPIVSWYRLSIVSASHVTLEPRRRLASATCIKRSSMLNGLT